jgi:hypothetical protein
VLYKAYTTPAAGLSTPDFEGHPLIVLSENIP